MKFHVVSIDGFVINDPEEISDESNFFIDSFLRVNDGTQPLFSVDAYRSGRITIRCTSTDGYGSNVWFAKRNKRDRSACIKFGKMLALPQR